MQGGGEEPVDDLESLETRDARVVQQAAAPRSRRALRARLKAPAPADPSIVSSALDEEPHVVASARGGTDREALDGTSPMAPSAREMGRPAPASPPRAAEAPRAMRGAAPGWADETIVERVGAPRFVSGVRPTRDLEEDDARPVAPPLAPHPAPPTVIRPVEVERAGEVAMHRERSLERAAVPARPDAVRPVAPSVLVPSLRPAPSVARPAAVSMQPTPPPTIQVTIGRVEIRATQQASPPRPARSATPRLSLEEYLRSRSGGGR